MPPIKSPCPPAPLGLATAARTAAAAQSAAQGVENDLKGSMLGDARHSALAAAYAEELEEVAATMEWLERAMRGYGQYLRRHAVRPEHIVICVREALEAPRLRQFAEAEQVVHQAVGWTIKGYYAEGSI